VEIQGYTFRFDGVTPREGANFKADRGTVTVLVDDREIAVLHPEKRAYASGGQIMTEAAIDPALHRDLYVALGEPLGKNAAGQDSWALRVYVKPWIRCIWLGALLMMFGGLVAAADRRFRRVEKVDLGEVGSALSPAGAAA
jgi:cytochrome c-type biogenesis protein CcmF